MKINLWLNKYFPSICLLIFTFFFLLRLLIIGSKSTDLAGIEQNVIYSIQTFLYTGKLYFSPSDAPFSITQYTPLYYYLCTFTAKLTGCSANEIHALYLIARGWNLMFNIISACFIFTFSHSILSLSRNRSYLLFLLSFTILVTHNFAARPDSLHDMMGIASIYFFSKFHKNKLKDDSSLLLLLLSIILSAVAVFAKQSGIQFIIILTVYSILTRDWKTLAKTIISATIIYSLFIAFFRYIHPAFFQNVIGGVINGIDIKNFCSYILLNKVFILSVWPIVICTLFILVKTNCIFSGPNNIRLLGTAVLGTLLFATATALKMGSTVQYYNVFINLSLMFIIAYFSTEDLIDKSFSHSQTTLVLNAFLFFIIALYGAQNIKTIYRFDHNPVLEAQRIAARKAADYILNRGSENSGRYVFANLATDFNIPSRQSINNILYKNCLVPQMDILEYSTGPSKVVGYINLHEMLINGEIEYIIESRPKNRFAILNDLEEIRKSKYILVKEIEGYLIYKYSSN